MTIESKCDGKERGFGAKGVGKGGQDYCQPPHVADYSFNPFDSYGI